MTKYATDEKMYQCWGCGFDIPWRSMWSNEEHPNTHRCPKCDENILVSTPDGVDRSATYWHPLGYADTTHPMFDGMHRYYGND